MDDEGASENTKVCIYREEHNKWKLAVSDGMNDFCKSYSLEDIITIVKMDKSSIVYSKFCKDIYMFSVSLVEVCLCGIKHSF
jgi:hypothetical protein